MSLLGALGVARDALTTSSAAIAVTGQNVANATTVGYARRVAVVDETAFGGVAFNGAARTVDRFATASVVEQDALKSAADARAGTLSQIESVIAPAGTTIADRATALMASFQTLAAYPNDTAARSGVLAKADDLAGAVSAAATGLADVSSQLFEQARAVTAEVNERLGRIASLNEQIARTKASGADDASLRDQRDIAVREVGQRLGARAVEDASGRVTLFAAGTALVSGERATPLSVSLDPTGELKFTAGSSPGADVTARVESGTLGGLREARDVDLKKASTDLDAYAYDVASTINAVHAAGVGRDGASGRNLFAQPTQLAGAARAMTLDPATRDRPAAVAVAATTAELPGGNGGAVALAQLADHPVFGGMSLVDWFAAMASDVGARSASAMEEADLRAQTLSTAEAFAANASGVSIDEEMTNLSQYQRAFQASSQVLKTVESLFDTLMNLHP